MEQNLIFKNCRYFDDPHCPSPNPETMMRAVKTIIVLPDGDGVYGMDGLDFIRQCGEICSACKEHKASNPVIP